MRAWMAEHKRSCACCGLDTPAMLSFVDPETYKAIGLNMNQIGINPERRAAMADKAIVLCRSCLVNQRCR